MMKCRERSHTSFIGSCLTFGRIHISSLWPLPLNSPQNCFSSQKENIVSKIMEFRVHISVNVCKVRPIEYYLQRLPLPVSGWEWQLRENKIDLCDRRDQQPTHQTPHKQAYPA